MLKLQKAPQWSPEKYVNKAHENLLRMPWLPDINQYEAG